MNNLNGSTNKRAYQKPLLVELNSQETYGGTASPVQETNAMGSNQMRKQQSLGPPPS